MDKNATNGLETTIIMIIIGGNYSQAPYGDFWTDSGNNFFDEKRPKSLKRPGSPKPFFWENSFVKCGLFVERCTTFAKSEKSGAYFRFV